MSQIVHLNISGMTCVNCQNKIEKALNVTDGIIHAKVSYNNEDADVEYQEDVITVDQILSVIEGLEYGASLQKKTDVQNLVNTISLLIIIVALYVMLQSLGILNRLVPSRLADTGMGYGMLFVIGLITSVHCVAMCGGINLSQCIPQAVDNGLQAANKSQNPASDSVQERRGFRYLLPALTYNLGRVCSYTVVGFVLGLVGWLAGGGETALLSALVQGILKMIAGVFMIVMGINMLGLFPWLRKYGLRMPRFLAKFIYTEKARARRPFVVGILNGFLPCGPLQSMWIVALASGNPVTGALSMLLFSLGTVPLMLGLGSIVSVLGKRFADKVMLVGAVLVVVLGLAMLSQGGTLSGLVSQELLLVLIIACGVAGVIMSLPIRRTSVKYMTYVMAGLIIIGSYAGWSLYGKNWRNGKIVTGMDETDRGVEMIDGVQVIHSTLSPGSYPSITVKAGVPVQWIIDAPEGSINGCNYRMLIQNYQVEHTFTTGDNLIEFLPTDTGTVQYSCWMGMIYGNIYVTDDTNEWSENVSK